MSVYNCLWITLLAGLTRAVGNVSVVRMQLSLEESHSLTLNSSIEYMLDFIPNSEQMQFPSRIFLRSDGGDTAHPILVTARQSSGAVSWQLPYVSQEQVLYELESTLCPDDPRAIIADSECSQAETYLARNAFMLHVSSTCLIDVVITVLATPVRDFLLPFQSSTRLQAGLAAPKVFFYQFREGQESVRLVMESEDEVCALVSIQNYTCPILQMEDQLQLTGARFTMLLSGGVQLSRSRYPRGFYVVTIVKVTDAECVGEDSPESWLQQALTWDEEQTRQDDTARTKTVTIRMEPSLTRGQYAIATAVTVTVFVLFYVVFFGVVLAQRWPACAKLVSPNAPPAEFSLTETQIEAETAIQLTTQRRARRSSTATFDSSDNSDTDEDESYDLPPRDVTATTIMTNVSPHTGAIEGNNTRMGGNVVVVTETNATEMGGNGVVVTEGNATEVGGNGAVATERNGTEVGGNRVVVIEGNSTEMGGNGVVVTESNGTEMGGNGVVVTQSNGTKVGGNGAVVTESNGTEVGGNGAVVTESNGTEVGGNGIVVTESNATGVDRSGGGVDGSGQVMRATGAAVVEGNGTTAVDGNEVQLRFNGEVQMTAATVRGPSCRDSTPFGLPHQLNLAALSRHRARILRVRSDRYLYTLYTVAVFYALPVVQFVSAFQIVFNVSGSLDICYYNFLCSHPTGALSDFNHVFSNLGYMLLGALFMLQVRRRRQQRKRTPRNEVDLHTFNSKAEYGIPAHYGLFSSLGAGMMVVGLLSASYHVCPNRLNFQFDTAFMYVLAVLTMVKIYQSRHPDVNARAHATFGILAVFMFLVVWGVLGGGPFFWSIFTVLHLFTFLMLSLRIYYVGQFRLEKEALQRAARQLAAMPRRGVRPLYRARLVLLLIANGVNWAFAIWGLWTQTTDFAGHLLQLLLLNALIHMVFYMVMKLLNRERPLWYAWCFLAGAAASWAPALYFFLSGSSDWSATPAASRHMNHECKVLQFYDSHDLWHMLSAVALYLSFNAMLTWDDGLAAVKRTDLAVF